MPQRSVNKVHTDFLHSKADGYTKVQPFIRHRLHQPFTAAHSQQNAYAQRHYDLQLQAGLPTLTYRFSDSARLPDYLRRIVSGKCAKRNTPCHYGGRTVHTLPYYPVTAGTCIICFYSIIIIIPFFPFVNRQSHISETLFIYSLTSVSKTSFSFSDFSTSAVLPQITASPLFISIILSETDAARFIS